MEQLSYEEFQNTIKEKIQERLGNEYTVEVNKIVKNKGIVLKGMSFQSSKEEVSPTIYLESHYEAYRHGFEIEEIIDRILYVFHEGSKKNFFNVHDFLDYDKAKERIVFKLVNTEKNKELLKQIPHTEMMDMSIVYYYLLKNDELQNATILIYNNHLENWGITLKELDRAAKKNAPILLKPELTSMSDLLEELLGSRGIEDYDLSKSNAEWMYVLSNESKIFGAAVMLYKNILKDFVKEKNVPSLYIIPSSVHEVILIPYNEDIPLSVLQNMVKEVNETQVDDIEILSDTIYCYLREEDKICVATEEAV